MNKAKSKKLLLYFLAIALGLAVGISIKSLSQPYTPSSSEGESVFTLKINDGDETVVFRDVPFEEEETLFRATQRLTDSNGLVFEFQDYGDMGSLVTQIGEKEGGQDGFYWQYWVNGEYAQVGASFYQIKSGDEVEWRFAGSEQ